MYRMPYHAFVFVGIARRMVLITMGLLPRRACCVQLSRRCERSLGFYCTMPSRRKLVRGNGDSMMMHALKFLRDTMKLLRRNTLRGWRTPVSFWKGRPKVGWLSCGRRCKNGRKPWISSVLPNFGISRIPCLRQLKRIAGLPAPGPRTILGTGGLWRDWVKTWIFPVRLIPLNVLIFLMFPELLWSHRWSVSSAVNRINEDTVVSKLRVLWGMMISGQWKRWSGADTAVYWKRGRVFPS